ncbi:MAG: ATP-binding protein, partial [Lachnospiraceae bacterium]
MFKKVSAYIEKYHMLSAGDTVVTGVSGGADSVCLLLVLSALQKEIPFTLVAVHVNHLIRSDAGKDAAFVKDLCEKCGVPFFLVEKDVEAIAKEKGISTEEAGRQVRYEAFTQVLQQEAAAQSLRGQTETAAAQSLRGQTETATAQALPGRGKIAVAHNLNDRAETMLFNLFRGSGLTGLGSIRPIRYGGDGPDIIRPLLCVTRAEIEDFLTGM